jgi:hypothetical protein
MLTIFCLLVYGMWPNQLGIPVWALFISIGVDLAIPTIIQIYELKAIRAKHKNNAQSFED